MKHLMQRLLCASIRRVAALATILALIGQVGLFMSGKN